MANMEWRGLDMMLQRMDQYGDAVRDVPLQVAQEVTPQIEADAKRDAPWTDRTSNARQGLHGRFWQEDNGNVTVIRLAHGMFYGRFLELRWQGRYAIILPTLQRYYGVVRERLRERLGGR